MTKNAIDQIYDRALEGKVPIDTELSDNLIEDAFNAEPLIGIIRHRLQTDGAREAYID